MSEFGKGFTYCIGLFLMHADRYNNEATRAALWFNGASDHLFELQIPEHFELKDACEAWKQEVLDLGHGRGLSGPVAESEIEWALDKAKGFLMAWDKQCGVATEKGSWE